MRITILGTGALACRFGAKLAAFAQVTLVGTWVEALENISQHGILLEEEDQTLTAQTTAARLGASIEPADLVLVLIKSYQTERVAPYLPELLKPEGVALTLQNGLGNREKLGPRVSVGVTALGATVLGPGRVRTGGNGPTYIAAPHWVSDLLNRAGFETHSVASNQIDSQVWGKLAVNCGLNPLTALLGVPNGELLNRPDAIWLMEQAALECAAVAHAKGITLPYADAAPRVREAAQHTATNHSSMLQDVQRGALTEIDAINGAVVREGEKVNVPTPVNEVLWRLVRAISKKFSADDADFRRCLSVLSVDKARF